SRALTTNQPAVIGTPSWIVASFIGPPSRKFGLATVHGGWRARAQRPQAGVRICLMAGSESERGLRELVAPGCRILGANGHDDYVWGHVSARDPEGRGVWMKGSAFGFDEITGEQVILVS